MRVSNAPRRHTRSRNNPGRRNNNSPNNPYENSKDNKIKGNAIQVHERYQSMARDAISSGDIVKAEYYFQHAEHYHRIHISALNSQLEKQQKNEKNIVPLNKEDIKKKSLEESNAKLEINTDVEAISDVLLDKENNIKKINDNNK